jgi:hypothetical protein
VVLTLASWASVASAVVGCSRWGCGTNSPVVESATIEGRGFQELNMAGAANFVVTSARKNGRQPDPDSPKSQGPRTLQAE